MEIMMRRVEDVVPYEDNPRINEGAVKHVAASLRRYGWQQPLVVDRDGVLIVGHTRLLAARELGMAQVPVVVADLDAEQARAYRIADNKTHEYAEWDTTLLAAELEAFDTDDMVELADMTGFAVQDINDLLGNVARVGMPDLKSGEKPPFEAMTFILHTEQAAALREALRVAREAGPFDGPNENSNGNALARLVEWASSYAAERDA